MPPEQPPPPQPPHHSFYLHPQRPIPERLLSTNTNKYSLRSHSSSFEADDERSSSEYDRDSIMRSDGEAGDDERYEGEDTRLTSKKELWGWYVYGFAAEVFIICGIGSFIPITLEQLARENGVLLSDHITPCPASSSRPSIPGHGAANLLGLDALARKDTGQCVIYLLGSEINTASFAMYSFSISVFIQALLVVSISCAADHGNYRKRLLLGFAFTGSVACMLFIAVVPKLYLLGALLAIISNTCLGASFVLLNSFLPLLVRHHPLAQAHLEEEDGERTPTDHTTPLLAPVPERNLTSIELQLSTKISSLGIGIGYSAGLLVQCFSIVVLLMLRSTTFSLRLVLFLIGLWWFSFTIPAALWLRPRPGPPLEKPSSSDPSSKSTTRTWLAYIAYSWKSLFRTISYARQLKDITLFLLTWFLLSDAIATVSGTAVLFAKTQLHMPSFALGVINVIATTAGVIGAFSWSYISRFFNLRPHQTILACIAIFEIIPVYGLLGYIPAIQRLGYLGLQQPWEMYVLGAIYGFVLGGLSSYCRSLFGELIPPGSEAAFYALYAITDKGSSVFGPAIVGAIVDATGEIRPAFWFLAVLIGLPFPLLWFVDVERGRREGRGIAAEIEGRKNRERNEEAERALLRDDD